MPTIANPCPNRRGFTLIELLVVIAIIGVLIALLLPAVQAARAAAARAQCASNLKQLALAILTYQDAQGGFPMGGYFQPAYTIPNDLTNGNAWLVSVLPYMEQQTLYNIYNVNMNSNNLVQLTAHGTAISTLWCPSDPTIKHPAVLPASSVFFAWEVVNYPSLVSIQLSSYATCTGSWFGQSFDVPAINDSNNGLVYLQSHRKIADVTDGTHETILLGERAHGLLAPAVINTWHWQFFPSRVMFTAEWPMNPQRTIANLPDDIGNILYSEPTIYLLSASSFHPGGCNFAFVDGSVHFIKESIDCWPIDPTSAQPLGLSCDASGVPFIVPGAKVGVYQALATCRNGEMIGEGQY